MLEGFRLQTLSSENRDDGTFALAIEVFEPSTLQTCTSITLLPVFLPAGSRGALKWAVFACFVDSSSIQCGVLVIWTHKTLAH